eukprot:m.186555 g.186555  ORF g.186555 m.186555 type:complete len:84 (+) comp39351_c0_seq4:297-548(+)
MRAIAIFSDRNILDGIEYLPIGSERDRKLPNGRDWLPDFWTAALDKATLGCSSVLFFCEERFNQKLEHVLEKRRMAGSFLENT